MNINTTILSNGIAIAHHHNFENKPTIIFLHDSLGCIQTWRNFPQLLADKTQCNYLIYDRIGYGKSQPMTTHIRPKNYLEIEADKLNDLLTELKLDNVILFGHSDGGSIALLAASKYPQKIKALIIEAAHIFVEEVTLKGIYDALELYNTTNLPQRLEKYHGDKVETLVKAWTETWTRADYQDWNVEYMMPNIIAPLLFIQGEHDEYGTLAQVEKTVNNVSGKSEAFIIPNIGHTPHKECPEIVLEKVVDFLSKI